MFLLKDIKLQNFRSHSFTELKTNHLTICIIGPNGSGKTNILEAIYLRSLSRYSIQVVIEQFEMNESIIFE